ncbi:MAG: transcriptional regulator [Actinomycetota bacterium]|nr:transcriptional regulator [Actinomycetota bacterium]
MASRGDWAEAFELFMALETGGSLDPADLPILADVAYAAGHLDVTITAWERVYAACLAADDAASAGGAAARVAMHLLFDSALMAPVRGWLTRAERLLESEADSPAHAWHAVVRTYERLLSGNRDDARRWAERAVEVGSKLDPAAAAIGRVAVARLLILDGDVDAGLALLEEVGVSATSGELDPLTTGLVYCELVCALQGVAQYDLAEEWTDAMERWCETNAIGSLHGRCRVHRAEILRLRGRCAEAELEAVAACDELRPYLRRELGWPLTELGQIRFRKGDVAGAEDALLEAHRAGWDPQPGLAGVRLAQGEVAVAVESIRDALDRPVFTPSKERPPNNSLHRAPLLAAQVEIEVAGGDLERARRAADELERVAARFKSKAFVANARLATGRVQLAEGKADKAAQHFDQAVRIWRDIGAPFELALSRQALAEAYVAMGRDAQAELEFDAARSLRDGIARASGEQADDRETTGQGADRENQLVREGDYWAIAFAGRTVRIQDLKGIHYLTHLLADPGREFHVLDLVNLERGGAVDRDRSSHAFDADSTDDSGLVMLDDQARTAYKRRLVEIDDDIDEARAAGDMERAVQAEGEREFLMRELSRAFGLGGRTRKSGAASERARAAATRALRTAADRIAQHHPPLGEHLRQSLRTGTYCSYQPDPRTPIEWRL